MAYCFEEQTGCEGEEGIILDTSCLDLRGLLKNNNLSQLGSKLIDNSGLTLDHLLNCNKQDLENICNDLNINSIDKIKLITAIKELSNSAMNMHLVTKSDISIDEKRIMDKFYTKKQILSQNIKHAEGLMNKFKQNEIDCNQQINLQCDNIVSIIETYRKTLLQQSQNIQSDRQDKLQQRLDEMNNEQKDITICINQCQNVINNNFISTSTKLKEMENISNNTQTLICDNDTFNIKQLKEMVVVNNLNTDLLRKHLTYLNIDLCEFELEDDDSKTTDGNTVKYPNFEGVWKLIKYENFDEYMRDEKYNFFERTLATKLKDILNVACYVTHKDDIITLNTKMQVGINFREDVRHGNLKSQWIMDGKTHSKQMMNKYVIQKTCVWNKNNNVAVATSYDVDNDIKRVYKVYLRRQDIYGKMNLCLERVNANNVSMIQIFEIMD